MEQEKLITRKELTEILNVTIQTIRNYEKRGLPIEVKVGDKPRYSLLAVMEWLHQNETIR